MKVVWYKHFFRKVFFCIIISNFCRRIWLKISNCPNLSFLPQFEEGPFVILDSMRIMTYLCQFLLYLQISMYNMQFILCIVQRRNLNYDDHLFITADISTKIKLSNIVRHYMKWGAYFQTKIFLVRYIFQTVHLIRMTYIDHFIRNQTFLQRGRQIGLKCCMEVGFVKKTQKAKFFCPNECLGSPE